MSNADRSLPTWKKVAQAIDRISTRIDQKLTRAAVRACDAVGLHRTAQYLAKVHDSTGGSATASGSGAAAGSGA
jgi:hypothetical protein